MSEGRASAGRHPVRDRGNVAVATRENHLPQRRNLTVEREKPELENAAEERRAELDLPRESDAQ